MNTTEIDDVVAEVIDSCRPCGGNQTGCAAA